MRNHFQYSVGVVAAVVAVGASISSCSTETADNAEIVATTGVWADVASAVTGNDVDAIITGDAVDPHHFEPSAKDLARIKGANTVVANGGAYDAALYTAAEQDRIVYAIPLLDEHEAHEHDHEHAHDHDHMLDSLDELEHAWFAPEKVLQVAEDIADRTGGDASDVKQRIGEIQSKLNAVPHVHIGMTETIAAGLVWGTELHDITPEEYVKASLNHQEPSASAVAAFLEQIERGELDMLFVNPQSTNSATQRLADAAKAHNVPVVEIRETPPAGQNFLDYFEEIVGQITDIAAHAEPTDHHH
ncbi:metal ABC transporter solute-binding protein, Zn/Mn family [Corynebacterium afermentans]|uniref:metal ABC transporter solute-binding protein, Zn/Mn family n=1 Tax=Corynebacterium afermentans TaxID=38286 RepID=UPI000F8798DA|nr:zinc ABC transporter substrate-binding protein [Corynebacterium afermentans]MDC7109193.1 zinc ABC transporter substrate-binding protein [Corynebacterium afermentans]RUQ12113.1 ABC transporter substrate-binding protein [Corynebacterium genitalium]